MLTQLSIGSLLTLATIFVAAVSWWGLERLLMRLHSWSIRPPHGLKLMVILSLSLVWTLGMMTIAVWVWAVALRVLEIFITFEASVYFSLVAFTTLGFGDLLRSPIVWDSFAGNALLQAGYVLVFGAAAIARFATKDVLS